MDDQPRPDACPATTSDGVPCRGAPLDSGWCFAHDPALAEQRAHGRRRGGHNRSTTARALASMPDPLAEATEHVTQALRDVRAGTLPAARAQAIASLTRALVAVWSETLHAERLAELEADVDALRAATLPPMLRAVP